MQYNVLIHLVQCMYGIIVRSQGLWTEPRAGFVTRDSGELGIKQCQRRGNDRESIGITTFVSTRTGLQNAFKPFAGEPRASFAGEAVVTRASSRWRRMGFSSPWYAHRSFLFELSEADCALGSHIASQYTRLRQSM
jgi:hypothetical protein